LPSGRRGVFSERDARRYCVVASSKLVTGAANSTIVSSRTDAAALAGDSLSVGTH
jgi:hypothetical protein